jgi:hypothetical protein
MSTVAEIEEALQRLPAEDARAVAQWLQEYLDRRWDEQIERDAESGVLDKLWAKAEGDIAAGRVKPLNEILDNE